MHTLPFHSVKMCYQHINETVSKQNRVTHTLSGREPVRLVQVCEQGCQIGNLATTQSGNPSCSAPQLGLPNWAGNLAQSGNPVCEPQTVFCLQQQHHLNNSEQHGHATQWFNSSLPGWGLAPAACL